MLTLDGTNKIVAENLSTEVTTLLTPKNWIINGGFDVWQRGTSFTNTTVSWKYSADRWKFYSETSVTATVDKTTLSVDGVTVDALYWVQNTTANITYLSQYIEGNKLQGKTVSLSFYADSPTNILCYLGNSAGRNGFSVVQCWNYFTRKFENSFTADSSFVHFICGSGGGSIKLAQVNLVIGDVNVKYQQEAYADVLRQCKRYYRRYTTLGGAWTNWFTGFSTTSTNGKFSIDIDMRPVSSIGYYGIAATEDGIVNSDITSMALAGGDYASSLLIGYSTTGGLTAWRPNVIGARANANAYFEINAEL